MYETNQYGEVIESSVETTAVSKAKEVQILATQIMEQAIVMDALNEDWNKLD